MRIAQINNNTQAPSSGSMLDWLWEWRKIFSFGLHNTALRGERSELTPISISIRPCTTREFHFFSFVRCNKNSTRPNNNSNTTNLIRETISIRGMMLDTFGSTVIKIWFIEDVVIEIVGTFIKQLWLLDFASASGFLTSSHSSSLVLNHLVSKRGESGTECVATQ